MPETRHNFAALCASVYGPDLDPVLLPIVETLEPEQGLYRDRWRERIGTTRQVAGVCLGLRLAQQPELLPKVLEAIRADKAYELSQIRALLANPKPKQIKASKVPKALEGLELETLAITI